jgi:iron complex outermembrane recepter protein
MGMKTTDCGGRWSSILRWTRSSLAGAPAAAITVALLTPNASWAADTASPEAASGALDEVIVTATRREEKLQDVPISTSVLAGDSLAVLGDSGQDIRQLAFKVPSLNIESSNGRTFPRFYIRGYGNTDFTSFASQPVSLVYDDIVQENPALKGFPIFDQADVEVLRGPQGTLFGRNSPAGVVKLESAKPELGQFDGYASVSDGTYNTANFEGVVNVPINDEIAFRASTQGQHRDNWVTDPINDTRLEGYDDWALRLQMLFKPSDTFTALLNVHGRTLDGSARLFRANIITPGTNDLIPGFNPATIYTDGRNGQNFSSAGANLHLTWDLQGFSLQSITGFESVLHYFTIGDIDGGYGPGNVFCQPTCTTPSGPGPIPFGVETGGGLNYDHQYTQEFRVVSTQPGPLQGQAGVFLFYEDVNATSYDYDITGTTETDTTTSVQKNNAEAIFGSLEYTVIPDLKVRGGVRFTEDHKIFSVPYTNVEPTLIGPLEEGEHASNTSWDLSATYQVVPDVNLYARIATGFRAPSFGAPTSGQAIQLARSEDNTSYETGVKAELFEHRARVDFDVYYYDVKHQQLTAVGGLSNQTVLLNANKTIGKGAEMDFEANLTPALTFNLSGSINDTTIDDPTLSVGTCFSCTVTNPTYTNATGTYAKIDGNPLPQAAKYIGDASLRYEVPIGIDGKLYGYIDWSYRSEINFLLYTSKEFVGAPLAEGGLRLGYTWANGKYDVAAFCRNCTNQIRIVGAIDFDNLTGFINDPRIVGGQVRVRF